MAGTEIPVSECRKLAREMFTGRMTGRELERRVREMEEYRAHYAHRRRPAPEPDRKMAAAGER